MEILEPEGKEMHEVQLCAISIQDWAAYKGLNLKGIYLQLKSRLAIFLQELGRCLLPAYSFYSSLSSLNAVHEEQVAHRQ